MLELTNTYNIYQPERCFSTYAATSGLLVILDGLDEVSAANYQKAEAAINGLSTKLAQTGANNIVCLTMRTQFHLQVWRSYAETFPVVLSLKRFSPTDIYAFLTRWPFEAATKAAHVVRIFDDLTDRPALREMCTNPLILSMYVAQDQASGHQLAPESRSAFYKQVTEELLIRRRAKQLGPTDTQTVLRRQRERILGRIAFEHLCDGNQPANLIPWEDGMRIVAEITGLGEKAKSEKLLRDISKETGLISEEREGETFRFIHLTFCEFLAAMEATQGSSDGWNVLKNAHALFSSSPRTTSRLAEVIPFAASLLPEHMQPRAIEEISGLVGERILALTFLETKRYEHPIWSTFIDRYRSNLVGRAADDWSSEWLAEVHLFLVVADDANRSADLIRGLQSSNIITEFFKHFADENEGRLIRLISSYAQQDALSALRVSTLFGIDILSKLPAVVVDNLDQPAFLAITIERAMNEKGDPIRWAALFAEGGLRSPATASLLSSSSRRPWRTIAETISASHQWILPNFIPTSFYSDCLAIAHSRETLQHLQLLNYVRKLRAPGGRRLILFHARMISRRFAFFVALIYFGGTILAAAFLSNLSIKQPMPLEQLFSEKEFLVQATIVGLSVLLAEVLFIAIFVWLQKQCRLYEQICNVSPEPRSWARSSRFASLRRIMDPLGHFAERWTDPYPDSIEMPLDPSPTALDQKSFLSAGQMFVVIRELGRTALDRDVKADGVAPERAH